MNGAVVDVVVIGGGIAGLAAAYELELAGLDVRLLEASPRLGGVIHTERTGGWVIDEGPDALLVQKPAAVELCQELGLGDRLISTRLPRTAYVLRDGRPPPTGGGVVPRLPRRRRCARPLLPVHVAGKASHGVRGRGAACARG